MVSLIFPEDIKCQLISLFFNVYAFCNFFQLYVMYVNPQIGTSYNTCTIHVHVHVHCTAYFTVITIPKRCWAAAFTSWSHWSSATCISDLVASGQISLRIVLSVSSSLSLYIQCVKCIIKTQKSDQAFSSKDMYYDFQLSLDTESFIEKFEYWKAYMLPRTT